MDKGSLCRSLTQDEVYHRKFVSGYLRLGMMSTKADGTGLGTKIVKDVIDAHRGKITVESDVGQGTTFRIHLPLDPDHINKPKK